MKKGRYAVSLLLNIIIVLLNGFGIFTIVAGCFAAKVPAFAWCDNSAYGSNLGLIFKFFTNDSNILLFLTAIVMIVADIKALKGKPMKAAPVIFKFAGTIGVVLTFLIVYCVLTPKMGFSTQFVFGVNNGLLWFHTVCPILAAVSFLGFELDPKLRFGVTVFGVIPLMIYAAVIVPLVANGITEAPYFFLDIKNQSTGVSVGWALGILAFAYLVSVLFFLVRKGLRRVIVEKGQIDDRVVEIEKEQDSPDKSVKVLRIVQGKGQDSSSKDKQSTAKTEDVSEAPVPKEAAIPAPAKEQQSDKQATPMSSDSSKFSVRVYHVSRHVSGKWQVKLATSSKPIKLFDTQEQAIAFAKDLVKSQGGSIRVHSMAGKMSKE